MRTGSLFHTTDLTVGYNQAAPLFTKLNLSLKGGQLICLMGPNGAGKSTLIRTLAGLQSPLSGSVSNHNQKHLSVVLTDKVSSSHMTAGELITFGRYPHIDWSITLKESDHEVISRVVAAVHIKDLLNKKLYELSDGQLQMVMIGRALVQETPVILLDEPTAHLDLNNRLEIMNLLGRLAHEEKKAILVATHELDLALQTADLIWLISSGAILAGIPEDLVLNGAIDEVFQFKGFDLKTGRVQHAEFRNRKVKIIGDGPVMLWTRNALERNGFAVDENGTTTVRIEKHEWVCDGEPFHSLEALLQKLLSN
jgi:iron complex transport system ATP-binding protein